MRRSRSGAQWKTSPHRGSKKETIRLHAANILIRQKKFDHARVLLGSVTDERLQAQKQKLLDQLPTNAEK